MNAQPPPPNRPGPGKIRVVVWLGAIAVAALSAQPYAGSWNDASRLATVESLVDHHSLAIDRSIFANPFCPGDAGAISPFDPADPDLLRTGTLDKLYVNGHYYSDKPPVQAMLMAGVYQVRKWFGGETVRVRPDRFCYLMNLAFAGAAYVLAVGGMYELGRKLRLPGQWSLCLAGSFGLATVAPAYTRHVNGHIFFLPIAVALFLVLVGMAEEAEGGGVTWPTTAFLGLLAGLGYTTDLAVGPLLLICLAPVLISRTRRPISLAAFALAAVPWLALHHSLNYAIGGTFQPANAVPAYFEWPGSPFHAANLTGSWNHTPAKLVEYSAALLFGKRGFVGHNLPLFLLAPALVILLRKRPALWRELWFGVVWSAATWLVYSALSRNYSGPCCSVRWFVPLLAPAYFAIALFLREHPDFGKDLLILSAWGAVLGFMMWWRGPWIRNMVPGFWPIQAGALLSWALYRHNVWRRQHAATRCITEAESVARAA